MAAIINAIDDEIGIYLQIPFALGTWNKKFGMARIAWVNADCGLAVFTGYQLPAA